MDWTIFAFLLSDGIVNGVIYGLMALALVLVFAVTRVIAVFIGEIVMFAPLSFALLIQGELPGTVWMTLAMLGVWAVLDRRKPRTLLALAVLALAVVGLGYLGTQGLPRGLLWPIALLIVLPMGPATFRLFYEPIPRATVLTYLILAVGLHFAYQGLGLVFFGPEQYRPPALWRGSVQLGGVPVSYQALFVVAFAVLGVLALYLFFSRTLYGKALRAAAVNRLGARLSGISPAEAGRVAFTVAAVIGAVSGMLIAPMTNAAYYMGFLLGLKGFVAAILGGLISYPVALVGALFVGIVESYSSFAASAYKEAIVFAMILPALLYFSLTRVEFEEGE
jgi:branched-chain amino acid transport system permease protein